MNKICLLTHIADADGAFPIILAKLVFEDLECFSCEVGEVDMVLETILLCQEEYAKIYIVDLNISDSMAKKIDGNLALKEKIKIFDHHISNEALNKYAFIQVIDEMDGHKECGTTLFYQHLCATYPQQILDKECVKTMVEFVREGDTYDFTEEYKEMAFQFSSLYSIYGRERYINHFYKRILETSTFFFSDAEQLFLTLEEEKTKKYIDEKIEHVKYAKISGMQVGIVFAEQKRSLLGHAMAERLDIDIAVVINISRSVSYRASKEDVDVTLLAKAQGGGGHKHAGGSPIPLGLEEKICSALFENIEWIK